MKVRLLVEITNPRVGCGPLLPGNYEADVTTDGHAIFGNFVMRPGDFEVIPEPHPFSPEGWAKIIAKLPRYTKEPGWIACKGPGYGGG